MSFRTDAALTTFVDADASNLLGTGGARDDTLGDGTLTRISPDDDAISDELETVREDDRGVFAAVLVDWLSRPRRAAAWRLDAGAVITEESFRKEETREDDRVVFAAVLFDTLPTSRRTAAFTGANGVVGVGSSGRTVGSIHDGAGILATFLFRAASLSDKVPRNYYYY